ncbi:primosomal protein [Kocuria sp. CPCC 205261]|uniref:primosomal protein n=1 Tax=Kocuria sp. CPCC 205261 TaxID=3073554 RepID=UPI0034D72767
MSTDPRAALQALVNALEEHLAAAANRRSDDDPTVDGAYLAIANTFEAYEEALYDAYDEVTPLTVFAEEDDSDDDLDYDDEDDDDDDDDLLEDNEMMDEDLVDEDDYDDDDDENEDRDSSNGRRSGR